MSLMLYVANIQQYKHSVAPKTTCALSSHSEGNLGRVSHTVSTFDGTLTD